MIKVKDNKKESLIQIAVLLGVLAVTVPVLIGCGYTYLCEDDFSFEGGANDMVRYHGAFMGPVIRAYEYYKSTQGTFLFNFLIHFIRAYTRWGLPGFHAVIIIFTGLFLVSLYMLICALTEHRTVRLSMMLAGVIAVFQLPGTGVNRELFFWYTGIFNFVVGLSMAFLASSCSIRSIHTTNPKQRRQLLVAGAVFGFLGSGCALIVTSPNCSMLLAILILNSGQFLRNKKLGIPFLSAFAGAMISVLSPGNYNLESSLKTPGHETLFDALRDTLTCYGEEARFILANRSFWVVSLLLFIMCVQYGVRIRRDGISTRWMLALIFGIFLMQYFTIFPVAYGRHTPSLNYARVNATYKIVGRLLYLFLVMCLAQWSTERFGQKLHVHHVAWKVAAAALIILFFITPRIRAEMDLGFSRMAYLDLKDGSMQSAYTSRSYLLSVLKLLPEGSDAHVGVPIKGSPRSPLGMGLLGDPEEFVNRSAAGLFRLNSVSVEYIYD